MPKRKGRKAPTRDPRELASAPKLEETGGNGAAKNGQKFVYNPYQWSHLWNRLEKIIGADYWIDEVIKEMQRRKIPHTVKQLRRRLGSLAIYPPPVERKHVEHRECWCKQCRARRSWPYYYVKDGQAYEHHLERQAMDDEAIEDEGLREELEKLRGESPSVVVDMRRQLGVKSGRRGKAA